MIRQRTVTLVWRRETGKKSMVSGSQTTPTAIGSPNQRGRSRKRRREFIAGLGGAAAWQVVSCDLVERFAAAALPAE